MDFSLTNLIVSTIAFFLASRLIGQWLESQGMPRGAARATLVFALALGVSYVAGAATESLMG